MLRDIRYALRWLARSPAFAAVAILSLGLGVGVNTAMFSLVDALLLRPIPVSDPDSLVDVFTTAADGDLHATNSYPDFQDIKARNSFFSDMIGYTPMLAAVSWPTPITETISAAATIVASMHRSPWAKLISSMMPYTIV